MQIYGYAKAKLMKRWNSCNKPAASDSLEKIIKIMLKTKTCKIYVKFWAASVSPKISKFSKDKICKFSQMWYPLQENLILNQNVPIPKSIISEVQKASAL